MGRIVTIAVLLWTLTVAASAQPKPTRDEQIDQLIKLNEPGPAHERLRAMVGDFKAVMKVWPTPKSPVETTEGKIHNEMYMGGRFLKRDFSGTMMGLPYKGMGL